VVQAGLLCDGHPVAYKLKTACGMPILDILLFENIVPETNSIFQMNNDSVGTLDYRDGYCGQLLMLLPTTH
jgi:hypothetical protein